MVVSVTGVRGGIVMSLVEEDGLSASGQINRGIQAYVSQIPPARAVAPGHVFPLNLSEQSPNVAVSTATRPRPPRMYVLARM